MSIEIVLGLLIGYYLIFVVIVKKKVINHINNSFFKYLLFFILLIFPFLDYLIGFSLYNFFIYTESNKNSHTIITNKKVQEAYWFKKNVTASILDKRTEFFTEVDKNIENVEKPFSQKISFKKNKYIDNLVGYLNYCDIQYDNLLPQVANYKNSCKYTKELIDKYKLKNILKVPYTPYKYVEMKKIFPIIGVSYFTQVVKDTRNGKIIGRNNVLKLENGFILSKVYKYEINKQVGKIFLKEQFEKSIIPNKIEISTNKPFLERKSSFLALDMNFDGVIGVKSVKDSNAYFDLTYDGIKERVGWIKKEDALLVYDKNKNNRIDDMSELFGNISTNGFEELKDKFDTNHDDVIDDKDELFTELKLWFDLDEDGNCDKDELFNLASQRVNSINLKKIKTNVKILDSLVNYVSSYKSFENKKYLVANVYFAYDTRITTVDLRKMDNFSIDVRSIKLPNLRGYGLVNDTFVTYNRNREFLELGLLFSSEPKLIKESFDNYIEEWVGLGSYKRAVLKHGKVSCSIDMSDLDKKIWILEHFAGKLVLSKEIEKNYEKQIKFINCKQHTVAKSIVSGNKYRLNKKYINKNYTYMKFRYESQFAILTKYKTIFKNHSLNINKDELEIIDFNMLNKNLLTYLNSDTVLLEDKIYLAKVIQMQIVSGNIKFDKKLLVDSISDKSLQYILAKVMKKEIL